MKSLMPQRQTGFIIYIDINTHFFHIEIATEIIFTEIRNSSKQSLHHVD